VPSDHAYVTILTSREPSKQGRRSRAPTPLVRRSEAEWETQRLDPTCCTPPGFGVLFDEATKAGRWESRSVGERIASASCGSCTCPLRRYAAVVGRYDVDPDDLLQQAFTHVLARDPAVIENLGAYVRRTIVNLASNERRRLRRAVLAAPTLVTESTTRDEYPSELADLLALEPRDRALLYLVEVEGSSTEDAARLLGMRAGAARMALTRARRRLRDEHVREAGQ